MENKEPKSSKNKILEYIKKEVKSLVIIFLGVLLVTEFFFQPCRVPSSSMKTNLLINDFYLAKKYEYGYSNSSFRILRFIEKIFGKQLIEKKILKLNEIKTGDVVIFDGEGNKAYKGKMIVKRVIANEGDEVEIVNGIIHINKIPTQKENIKIYEIYEDEGKQIGMLQKESLKDGESHIIFKYDMSNTSSIDNIYIGIVPKDHVFCMGDNRDNSLDSRDKDVRFIHKNRIIGKAWLIVFSFEKLKAKLWEIWKYPFAIRYDRIFTTIK